MAPWENVDSGWTKHWDSWIRVGKNQLPESAPRMFFQKKEEMDEDYQENWKPPVKSTSLTRDRKQANKQKTPQKILRVGENSHSVSQLWEEKWQRDSTESYQLILQTQESSDYSHAPSINSQSSSDASWPLRSPVEHQEPIVYAASLASLMSVQTVWRLVKKYTWVNLRGERDYRPKQEAQIFSQKNKLLVDVKHD